MKPQAIGLRRMMVAAVMGACATGLMVAAMSSGSAVAQNNPAATPAQAADNSADGTLPTVYSEENTGASFPAPTYTTLDNATAIAPFPDPFAWASDPLGKTRATGFKDWEHHRSEIINMIEHYEIGEKPAVDIAKQVKATWTATPNDKQGGTLTVVVTNGDNPPLTISSQVRIAPDAKAPYPIIIGMNQLTGGLPQTDFSGKGFAAINFRHDQTTTYQRPSASDPFFKLYPNLKYSSAQAKGDTGQYAAWAWGVSRIIDGLTLVQDQFPADLKHITVTGCSYAGKMALFSGALDERVALTVAQESGGGGATNWRYSAQEKEKVEGLAQTDHNWFASQMFQYGGANVAKLPEDHNMLCALCAPRALFVTGNTDYTWLSNPSNYANSAAVEKTYSTLGIADRFGFVVDGKHGHCQFPANQEPMLGYFVDKFMKGQMDLHQEVASVPPEFANIDVARWTAWWGTGDPVLPPIKTP